MSLIVTVPAQTNALTTLDTLKAELQITDASQDAYLETVIAQASAACARYCNRRGFGRESLEQTERFVWPRNTITLDRDLEPSIISITENGVALAASNWVLEGSVLWRTNGGYPCQWYYGAHVVITYTAGFVLVSGLPHDLERACLIACTAHVLGRDRDPSIRSEAVEDVGTISYAIPKAGEGVSVPPGSAALLDPWVLRSL